MICYIPFTVLAEHQIEMLADVPDALTVYSPAPAMVPERMRVWEQQGKLNIRHPQGVKGEQLLSALQNYRAWADLHQGRIGDMAGFFQAHQGRFPMMDETNPTQIGHQIRHYGETPAVTSVGPLFKAALFLSMAQEYDEHHHLMAREMDTVQVMEQQMLNQMTGGRDGDMEMPPIRPTPPTPEYNIMDDPYMTSQRVQAWSRLALEDPQSPLLYLTLSRTVAEHLLDIFPDAVTLSGQGWGLSRNQEEIRSWAFETDPQALELTSDLADTTSGIGPELTMYCLVGVSSLEFLTRLADQASGRQVSPRQGRVPANTLVGLVTPG